MFTWSPLQHQVLLVYPYPLLLKFYLLLLQLMEQVLYLNLTNPVTPGVFLLHITKNVHQLSFQVRHNLKNSSFYYFFFAISLFSLFFYRHDYIEDFVFHAHGVDFSFQDWLLLVFITGICMYNIPFLF